MINQFLKKSWIPLVFRVLALIGFVFMIFVLYFGSVKLIFSFTNTWVMLILWTLWWPFLYLSLFFLGRFWCGFICPMGLANEMGNALRRTKRNYLARYPFIPFVIIFFIIFWEQVSGLFFSTNTTLLFLSTFLLSAFLIGMILPRWGFCKYFCPVGTLLGVFSRLSVLGLRTNKDICKNCETKECIRGGKTEPCPLFNNVPAIKSNQNCLLCTNCIKNCPHNSAKLCFVKPGEEIEKKAGFNISESLFIVALLALTVLLTSKGTQIGRYFLNSNLTGSLLRAWDFVFWIGIFIILYLLITYISTKLQRLENRNFKENLRNGGYVFLPLLFSLMFFLIVFGFITPLTNFQGIWISISKYILLLIGTLWGIKLALSLFKKRAGVYVLSLILIMLFWALIILSGPLNISQDNSKIYFVEDGGIVNMNAFSMGFDPEIIKTTAGSSFKMNITSIDIVHSFDIDDLDIHMSFKGKSNINVKLRNLEPGEYEYYCAIPGHKEAGMKGILIVE